MGLVRGYAPFAGVEYAELTQASDAWGDTPGGTTFPEEWRGVPFLSETMELKRDTLPKSKEFGEASSTVFLEYGRTSGAGSMILQPRYNQQWFWGLIGEFMGSETVTAATNIAGTGSQTACNRHAFHFGTALSKGFSLRVYKGGNTAAGYIDEYIGCMISKLTWEQNQEDLPKITLDIVAKGLKSGAPAVITAAPQLVGKLRFGSVINPVYTKTRDLMNVFGTNSKVQVGATLTDLHISGFTLTVDRHLENAPVYTTDMDNPVQPGTIDTRDIEIELRTLLDDTYLNSGKPNRDFIDGVLTTKCRIQYASATMVAATSNPYAIMIDLPLIRWTEARGTLNTPGEIPHIFKARALRGTFATPTGIGGFTDDDLRVLMQVSDTDDATALKFSAF